jgi:sporulation protein YlmC with PRC-barrel domain
MQGVGRQTDALCAAALGMAGLVLERQTAGSQEVRMLSMISLRGKVIEARDGRIGSVDDVYFEDRQWQVRYLVVDTGRWLPGRQVLIAPEAILQDWHGHSGIPLDLTKEQVKASPEIDAVKPISRRAEERLYSHYGRARYRGTVDDLPVPVPDVDASPEEYREVVESAAESSDPHLHSTGGLIGYRVFAADGQVGQIEDLLIDDEQNRICFLVVGTDPGQMVLIPPGWISGIDQTESTVRTNVPCRDIETRPVYIPVA